MTQYTPQGNIIGAPTRLSTWTNKDRHQEARAKSRSKAAQPVSLFKVHSFIQSLRGRPAATRATYSLIQGLGYEKSVILPDLNLYRPGVNLKAMKEEMGIEHIILRMGGPKQFIYENFLLTEDPTWRGYFSEAVKLGFKSIGGYFVYSAGIDAQDYARSEILLDAIREWTNNGFMPDYIIADDEVNTWYESGRTVTATAVNQVAGLQYLYPKLWARHKKALMHYSAKWFLNNYPEAYATFFDNMNAGAKDKGPLGKQILNWYAWYIGDFNGKPTIYDQEADVLNKIPLPTSEQQRAYLSHSNWSLYDIHQFTSTLITPYYKNPVSGQPAGMDWSITRQSEAEFLALINKAPQDPGNGTSDPGNGGGTTDPTTAQQIAALQAGFSKLATWARQFPTFTE